MKYSCDNRSLAAVSFKVVSESCVLCCVILPDCHLEDYLMLLKIMLTELIAIASAESELCVMC